ncbi:MAG: monovalent cation/H+ antiporter complex subunit F [Anaerolineae bacterium]|nr:monovalent cation/H+ antiporter complex subunit F [Thermoflexales bacterium]MDW8406625.1 monovalent cation/H+ antiporter complex subunit F [Anaerolineae bacterium]
MKEVFGVLLAVALVIHVGLISVAVWRVWRGETVLDRLLAADVIGTLVLAVFVLMGLIRQNELFIDVALGFAALTFISTIALARYIARRQIF